MCGGKSRTEVMKACQIEGVGDRKLREMMGPLCFCSVLSVHVVLPLNQTMGAGSHFSLEAGLIALPYSSMYVEQVTSGHFHHETSNMVTDD